MFPFGFWNSPIWKQAHKLEKISNIVAPGAMSIPKAVNAPPSGGIGTMRQPRLAMPAAPVAPKI